MSSSNEHQAKKAPFRAAWIPSEEAFARAKAFMKERERGFDEVMACVKARFHGVSPLYDLWIFNARDRGNGKPAFDVLVFYFRDRDIEACAADGSSAAIEELIYAEFERVGRGGRDEIDIEFVYDSDENVKKNFGGSYYDRLH